MAQGDYCGTYILGLGDGSSSWSDGADTKMTGCDHGDVSWGSCCGEQRAEGHLEAELAAGFTPLVEL